MATRAGEIKSTELGIAAPNSQITAHAVTYTGMLERLKQVRLAVEDWIHTTSKDDKVRISTSNVSQSLSDSEDLYSAFIAHLSEAQETLLLACHKLTAGSQVSHNTTCHHHPQGEHSCTS